MIINPYAFGTPASDPSFANVSLLITGIGVDEATNITDSSSYAHTVTVVSGTKYESTLPPTGQSTFVYMGIAGMSVADHASLDMGSGDFTVETYFREDTFGTFVAIMNKVSTVNFSPFQLLLDVSSHIIYTRSSQDGASYTASIASGSSAYTGGTWYHLAWCRSGNTFYSWLDGASLGTPVTVSGSLQDTNDPLTIGYAEGGTNQMAGGVAGLRITKGVARYTTSFTPPALPLPTS